MLRFSISLLILKLKSNKIEHDFKNRSTMLTPPPCCFPVVMLSRDQITNSFLFDTFIFSIINPQHRYYILPLVYTFLQSNVHFFFSFFVSFIFGNFASLTESLYNFLSQFNFFAKFCCKFFPFFQILKLFSAKHVVNGYFDQSLECAAPKCWLKYTATNIIF